MCDVAVQNMQRYDTVLQPLLVTNKDTEKKFAFHLFHLPPRNHHPHYQIVKHKNRQMQRGSRQTICTLSASS
jgi:hypothetical protein